MELTLEQLKKVIERAYEVYDEYIGIAIETKDMPGKEIIINPRDNFKIKLDYYLRAYNEDCTLKANNDIRIVGIATGDYADSIVCELELS